MFLCCVGDLNRQLLILQALVEVCNQKIYDAVDVFLGEWLVEHDLIETVEKFGTEAALEQFGNRLSCVLVDLSACVDSFKNRSRFFACASASVKAASSSLER